VVYTLALNVAHLVSLHAPEWPARRVYIVGDAFDPAGLDLTGQYSDGSTVYHLSTDNIVIEGFDSSLAGDLSVQIKKYGVIAIGALGIDHLPVTILDERRLAFDPDIEADHTGQEPGSKPYSYITPPPSGYTLSPGRTLVLAPVKWHIPDTATYEWEVDDVVQSSTTGYLSFAYASFGAGDHTVTVRAKLNGAVAATAVTTVDCAPGAVLRQAGPISQPAAAKLFSVVAPGQFGANAIRLGKWNGFGGFGGYAVFRFDHSVERKGTDGKEIKVGGNLGPWTEPGAIWVSMDENNNGIPDDTWYEVAGSEHFAADTLWRYAVTFRDDYTWTDNLGGGGTYPSLQGYSGGAKPELTFVGTRLDKRTVSLASVWGYADVADDQKVSISNAVQANGDPADLPFIDFVKIVTAVHYADSVFGERSTEAGTPMDLSMNDPAMLLVSSSTSSPYYYYFKNDSVYDLIITFEGEEFDLPKKGAATTSVTKTSSSAAVYIDFRGGNVDMEIRDTQTDTAYFTTNGEDF
jgi:hypothetical protein